MKRKFVVFLLLAFTTGTFLIGAEPISLPDGAGMITPPAGWRMPIAGSGILVGPGDSNDPPRLSLATATGDPATTAASVRDGYRRIGDGCQFIDDDDQPLGGRVWRRIRVRFAVGPLVFVQTAWIGAVDGRTVIAVLSSLEEQAAASLATGSAAVASISAPR